MISNPFEIDRRLINSRRMKRYFNFFCKENYWMKLEPNLLPHLNVTFWLFFKSTVSATNSILIDQNFRINNMRRKVCSEHFERCLSNISNCINASKWNATCVPLTSTVPIVHMNVQFRGDRNVVLLPSLIGNLVSIDEFFLCVGIQLNALLENEGIASTKQCFVYGAKRRDLDWPFESVKLKQKVALLEEMKEIHYKGSQTKHSVLVSKSPI